MNKPFPWKLVWVFLLCLFGLWITDPAQYPECSGENVPRHCVE